MAAVLLLRGGAAAMIIVSSRRGGLEISLEQSFGSPSWFWGRPDSCSLIGQHSPTDGWLPPNRNRPKVNFFIFHNSEKKIQLFETFLVLNTNNVCIASDLLYKNVIQSSRRNNCVNFVAMSSKSVAVFSWQPLRNHSIKPHRQRTWSGTVRLLRADCWNW